jgi:large subunit ribosomal protein L10e
MALRKATAYSKKKARPFTRVSRVKAKTYIKVNPHNKLAKSIMGNQKAHEEGKHPFTLKVICGEKVQIRDNALEAARMMIHKRLEEQVPGEWFFAVKTFPHHILRENKTAAGAGADRLSSGMKHSYGVVVGRAAIVGAGKEIYLISCATEKALKVARSALERTKSKLPCKVIIRFERKAVVPAIPVETQ